MCVSSDDSSATTNDKTGIAVGEEKVQVLSDGADDSDKSQVCTLLSPTPMTDVGH